MRFIYVEPVDLLNRNEFVIYLDGHSPPYRPEVVLFEQQHRASLRHKWRRAKVWTSRRSGAFVDWRSVPIHERCDAPELTADRQTAIRNAIMASLLPAFLKTPEPAQ